MLITSRIEKKILCNFSSFLRDTFWLLSVPPKPWGSSHWFKQVLDQALSASFRSSVSMIRYSLNRAHCFPFFATSVCCNPFPLVQWYSDNLSFNYSNTSPLFPSHYFSYFQKSAATILIMSNCTMNSSPEEEPQALAQPGPD